MSGVTYARPSRDFNATLGGRGHTLTRLSLNKDRPNLIDILKGTVRDLTIAGYNSPGNVGRTSLIASSSRGGTLSGVVLTNCTWSLPSDTPGTSGFIYETLDNMTTITNCWLIDCKVIGNNATRGTQVIGGFVAKAAQLRMVDCHVVFSATNTVSIGNGIPVAGAFVGQVRYNAANKTFGICNALQCGAVSTASGFAGSLVGGIEESNFAGLTMSVSNAWIAGSAAFLDDGQTGLLFGGRDIDAENELTIELEGSKALESNGALALYYDKDNAAVAWDSPVTFGADALSGSTVRNALNLYAREHNYTTWVRGRYFPELMTFGTECFSGFFIKIR